MNDEKAIIQREVTPMLERAKSIVVRNEEQKQEAVSFVKEINQFKEKLEERFHPTENKKKTYEAYQSALQTEKAFYAPCDEAATIVKNTVKKYDCEEALKAQRAAREAEARRLEEERKERERLEAQAKKAEEKGKVEKAEALREQAEIVTVAPSFTPAAQPTKKLVWKARVVNPLLACKSIGEGIAPTSLVEFKQSELNALGKYYDGKTPIPGFAFYQDVANARIA